MEPAFKTTLRQQVQKFFLEFLEKFRVKSADGEYATDYYYVEQAKTMLREDRRTLYVKVSHLEAIDESSVSFHPSDLRIAIETKYMILRDALNATVPELLARLSEEDLQREFRGIQKKEELKFVVAFFELPMYSGIRDLRTDRLGQLLTICGTVTRTSDVKPELLTGTFRCGECRQVVTGIEQQFKVTYPTACTMRNCGNRTNWALLGESRTTRWGDWQRIRLQENENEVPAGSMPRSLDVIVRDEVCETCKPGDKILVTGSLIVVPDVPTMMSPAELKSSVRRSVETRTDAAGAGEGVRGLSGLGQRDLTYKLSFFGCFVDEDSDWGSKTRGSGENVRSDEKVYLSQSDKDRFQSISDHVGPGGKRDCFDVLARSIAPAIHGHLEVKKGVLLMLIGGIPKRTDEGIKLRGDINVCLIGDPATAKSAILKWTASFLPRAVFTSGKTSSAAGLTASVVKDMDLDNEKTIEPGALMLADNGVCCIDEFERMDQKDQVAIHEAMEQQTITLAKAGIKATLNARASILAAVLPKDTYYNPTRPIHKNVEMSPPIMSRFDLMFVIQDIHDVTTDHRVANHILSLHRLKEDETAPQLTMLDLQRYIRLARTFKPKITQEARERLVKCYLKLREDRTYVRGAAGVTVRQLESLIRLSEGIARVNLEETVTLAHVAEAFDLQFNSLRRVERENIDLGDEVGGDGGDGGGGGGDGDAPAEGGGEGVEANAAQRPRRMRITWEQYQRIGMMLAQHLHQKEETGEEVTEEDLIAWYMEQVEEEIESEAQLLEQQHKVQLIINRMIDKDRVIVPLRQSEDPLHPEGRVLVKHPNYVIGELMSGSRHAPRNEQR
eukprot:TRINITY_DN6783_c0_g1_i1.p1 TRINITY_DN6783_c0_g1~~TRINITY_DN6783_c0_g1_i1.p1  ORF type:complete len:841 (+),score=146.80 TRINITY_DN6783_c0_g1_i1:59-2581(+)